MSAFACLSERNQSNFRFINYNILYLDLKIDTRSKPNHPKKDYSAISLENILYVHVHVHNNAMEMELKMEWMNMNYVRCDCISQSLTTPLKLHYILF